MDLPSPIVGEFQLSSTRQSVQQARYSLESAPHVFQLPRVSSIGTLIFLENLPTRLRRFIRPLWRWVTASF